MESPYLCSICHEIQEQATSTNCGHSFCELCIHKAMTFKRQCPVCRSEVKHVVPSYTDRIKIDGLTIPCFFHENGCTETIKFRDRRSHEQVCPFRNVPCTYCIQPIPFTQLDLHQTEQCLHRYVPCPECNKQVSLFILDEHKKVTCPAIMTTCPSCKTFQSRRCEMSVHIETCPQRLIRCLFHGCQWKGCRAQKPDHDTSSFNEHLECMRVQMERDRLLFIQDGPFLVTSHPHSVMLCDDLHVHFCNECRNPLGNTLTPNVALPAPSPAPSPSPALQGLQALLASPSSLPAPSPSPSPSPSPAPLPAPSPAPAPLPAPSALQGLQALLALPSPSPLPSVDELPARASSFLGVNVHVRNKEPRSFGYRCIVGCDYDLCVSCFSEKRAFLSKTRMLHL